ncbi:hypothetical protein GGF31_003408 [Allomyces arbusculus]|nr:hypothetical protein GGF31_003408 [Allomyces arbusculus]
MHVRKSGTVSGTTHIGMESVAGLSRFTIGLIDEETETGNTGSNFGLWRYDDTGALIEKVYSISRASGLFELTREMSIKSTVQSTSNTTGALVIGGGVGIGGNTHVGGDLTVGGNIDATGGSVTFSSTTNSTSPTTGALIISGGIGVAKDVNVGGNLTVTGQLSATGGIAFDSTEDSTSVTTGALVLKGGLGVAKSMYLGGIAHFVNTTDSESYDTGALIVSGGVGVAGTTHMKGQLFVHDTTQSTSTATGSIVTAGGLGVAKNGFFGGLVDIVGETSTDSLKTRAGGAGAVHQSFYVGSSPRWRYVVDGTEGTNSGSDLFLQSRNDDNSASIGYIKFGRSDASVFLSSTTESTTVGTGALIVSGGGSFSGNLNVQKNAKVYSTADASSTSTGALIVSGGVGIAKSLYIGNYFEYGAADLRTSVSTGALVLAGGVGVAKNVNIGGLVKVFDITQSTSTADGAVVVAGGVGIAKQLNVGGTAVFESDVAIGTGTADYQHLKLGGGTAYGRLLGAFNQLSDGLHFTYNAHNDNVAWFIDDTSKSTSRISVRHGVVNMYTGDVNSAPTTEHWRVSHGVGTQFFTNVSLTTVSLLDTTESTSTSTGALVVPGGVGIAKNLNVGGIGHIYNTTQSTSLSTGAFVVDGGAAVAKSLNVGSVLGTWNGTSLAGNEHLSLKSTSGLNRFQFGLSGMEDTDNVGSNLQLWRSADNGTLIDSIFKIVRTTGQFMFQQTTQSTTSSTGSVVVSGGVGIAGNVNTGGNIGVGGSASVATTLTVGGVATVNDTTESLSTSTGAVVISGGAGIAKNINVGGSATIGGSTSIGGSATVTGLLSVNDGTQSTTTSNGAVVIVGGVGIGKNLNVGGGLTVAGNTVLNGNLIVNGGSITEVKTQTLAVSDNIILLNAGPDSSADSGVGIKRYQLANDSGNGDVVQDTPDTTGTARTGSTSTTVVLSTAASSITDFYKDTWIKITTGTGANQIRKIKSYNEGMDWTTVPDVTSQYAIFDTQYVLTYYDEGDNEYVFGSTPTNPASDAFVSIRDLINVKCKDVTSTGVVKVDTINEHTANAGVTVEGVTIKDGSNNENVDIVWESNEQPKLRHLLPISGSSGAGVQYLVKVIAV